LRWIFTASPRTWTSAAAIRTPRCFRGNIGLRTRVRRDIVGDSRFDALLDLVEDVGGIFILRHTEPGVTVQRQAHEIYVEPADEVHVRVKHHTAAQACDVDG